jgi:hypothetical protein
LKLEFSARFKRTISKFDSNQKDATKSTLKKFMSNPKSPGLNFESVRNAPGFFTIRANGGDRIVLERIPEGYMVYDIGTHDIYRRLNRN